MTRLGSFWSIMATISMVIAVVVATIAVTPVGGPIVATASWAMSARILIEAHFGLFGFGVLIGGCCGAGC